MFNTTEEIIKDRRIAMDEKLLYSKKKKELELKHKKVNVTEITCLNGRLDSFFTNLKEGMDYIKKPDPDGEHTIYILFN